MIQLEKERKGTCPACKKEIEYLDFVETKVGECYPTEDSIEWNATSQYSRISYKCPLYQEIIFEQGLNYEVDAFFK